MINTKIKLRKKYVAFGIEDFAKIDKTVLFITQEKIVKVLEPHENVKTKDAKTDTE